MLIQWFCSHNVYKALIIHDGKVFTSTTTTSPPLTLPSYRAIGPPEYLPGRDLQKTLWSCNAHPFLAYVPLLPHYNGPIFQRLNVNFDHAPVVKDDKGKHSLDPNIAATWLRLDNALFEVAEQLHGLVNLEFEAYRRPAKNWMFFKVNEEQHVKKLVMRC